MEADLENWTDPEKVPMGLVGGVVEDMGKFLQDPKGAPACQNFINSASLTKRLETRWTYSHSFTVWKIINDADSKLDGAIDLRWRTCHEISCIMLEWNIKNIAVKIEILFSSIFESYNLKRKLPSIWCRVIPKIAKLPPSIGN